MTDALNLCSFGSGIQSLSVQANKQETLNFYYRSNNARLGHFDACILNTVLSTNGQISRELISLKREDILNGIFVSF